MVSDEPQVIASLPPSLVREFWREVEEGLPDEKVKAGLLFVIANAFPKAQFDIKDEVKWDKWKLKHSRLQAAHDNDVWNPKPSGLCKAWCPVLSCSHNGRA